MNLRPVFHLISYMVIFVALTMGVTCLVSWGMGDPAVVQQQLLLSFGIALGIGGLVWVLTRGPVELTRKDGFGIVTFGWIVVGHIGAIPFILTGTIPGLVDALFETISGFTTTGASLLTHIDDLSAGILFWRSLTQWLGGMGVLLMCVAILPFLGIGGMQIYRAEMPGPSKDRLTPRIATTAKYLWGVYTLLTLAEAILLRIAGMNWFDAICHSFTTLSTGGFSTHIASIAYWDSNAIRIIITVFMFLGGVSFSLHYLALCGRPLNYFKNAEFRFYLFFSLGAIALLTWNVWGRSFDRLDQSIIESAFQAVSIITTTGFATADYDAWPLTSKTILFMLMFAGGCAGSTAGGLKIMRIQVSIKKILRDIRVFMQPQAVIRVKLGDTSIADTVIAGITSFVILFVVVFVVGTLAMAPMSPDLATAASSVIACLGNVGPGFAAVGPTLNFAEVPTLGKAVLTLMMLLGRLELFTVLIVFYPSFWRR